MSTLRFIYRCLFGGAFSTGLWPNIGLLLLRLHVGISMALGGKDKLPVPDWFVDQVAGLGFPAPAFFALLASLAEFAGGILLTLGLLTRPAAFFLAFTLGVAAFLFHGVTPITQLNITQIFFWSYVLFVFTGGGRFALDRFVWRRDPQASDETAPMGKVALTLGWLAALIIGFGLYLQLAQVPGSTPEVAEDEFEITSVSLAGNFNDWDLEATPMALQKDGRWSVDVRLTKPGPMEFKFAANGSWDANVGEADQESDELPLTGQAEFNATNVSNIRAFVPMAGEYRFTINPDGFAYTVDRATTSEVSSEDLIGEWQVDLRSTPDSEPSFHSFNVRAVDAQTLVGTFYDSEIKNGRVNTQWSAVHCRFVTKDGSNVYYSTAKLVNGRLEGTTQSPTRDLFSVWTAEKVK